ncbi:P-loop containing nucleoside triphosphate hydrolase protein, partial [Tricladium varicosporioides]
LYRIVVLGDGDVGKTAITQLFCKNYIQNYDPTVEDSFRKLVVLDGKKRIVEILDTTGHEEYPAIRDQWVRDGEAFVLVYSIWSRSSFTRITRYRSQIQRIKDEFSQRPSYPGSPVLSAKTPQITPTILVGHDYQEEEREVQEAEGLSLARELGCEYLEASAERGITIDNVFFTLIRILRNQRVA